MSKLEDLNNSFMMTKRVGLVGEKLASDVIEILHKIDGVLADFTKLQEDPELMAALADSAGGDQMNYSMTVAGILVEAKMKIEVLD